MAEFAPSNHWWTVWQTDCLAPMKMQQVVPLEGYKPVTGRISPARQDTTCVTPWRHREAEEKRNSFFYGLNTKNKTTLTKVPPPLTNSSFLLAISWRVLYLATCKENNISPLTILNYRHTLTHSPSSSLHNLRSLTPAFQTSFFSLPSLMNH
jgi:hypothetical protein